MLLSVIVASWNTRELLADCLTSALHSASSLGFSQCELIVVDNASTDGSAEMVATAFPSARLIKNADNLGFARANNQALIVAQGRYVLLLNSDATLGETCPAILIDALEKNPGAAAAGPAVFDPAGAPQPSYGRLPSVADEVLGPYRTDAIVGLLRRLRTSHVAVIDRRVMLPVDRVSFACTLIRREALDSVGLLDERFEFYSEDYDFFRRLKRAGWATLFCPQATATHHWGASSSQRSEWAMRQLYRSKRLYFAKHDGPNAESLLRIGLSLRFAAKATLAATTLPFRREPARKQLNLYRRLLADMQSPL